MAHGAPVFQNQFGSVGDAQDGNIFHPFFGTPNGYHAEVRADDQLSHETYNLPKAYEGKNKRLEDVLDFLIRKEDEFYTRDLMPWEYTDDLHITWDVWKFNRTLADVVPEQGISRLVTQESERHTDNLIRRGLGFQLEHGFMTTEKGRKNYALNLQQITDAVHTTSYFGVMHALFAGHNYYKEYRRKFARYVKSPRTLFRHERQMWACLQKDVKGLYVMDAEVKHFMKTQGVVPDVMVLPPKAGIYVSMVPPTETTYSERGPGAHEALTDGRTGITTFRGSKVFEAQAFDVDFRNEFIDLTGRPRMIGEYFVIPGCEGPRDMHNIIANGVRHLRDRNKAGGIKPRMTSLGNAVSHRAFTGSTKNDGSLNTDALDPLVQLAQSLGVPNDPYIHIYSADTDNWEKICFAEANMHAFNNDAASQSTAKELDNLHKACFKLSEAFDRKGEDMVSAEKTPRDKKEMAAVFTGHISTAPKADEALGGETRISDMIQVISGLKDNIKKALGEITNKPSAKGLVKTVDGTASDDGTGIARASWVCGALGLLNEYLHFAIFIFDADLDQHRYDILLMRPFATYTMHSAILAKGGKELGSTFHGHHDFQLSDNVATKTHFGNYTFYSKAVVRTPRNYTIIPDCFAQGYIAGEGTEFFSSGAEGDKWTGSLGEAIAEGTLGSPECKKSLIAWRIPRGEGKKLAEAIDIMGRFSHFQRDYESSGKQHFTGANILGQMEGIEELDQNRHDEHYLHQVQQVNTVCFRGAQWTNGVFSHRNRGHWGNHVYPGVLPVRDGALSHMDPSESPKVGDRLVEFD